MLQQMAVQVDSIGEDVVLSIGNCNWRMGFETALILSAEMRHAAKAAKRAAEDTSIMIGLSGVLHDASQRRFPVANRVPNVAKEVLGPDKIGARNEGTLVVLRFDRTEAKLPYQACFKISQWVRIRAKESKVRAGDVARRWETIARVE